MFKRILVPVDGSVTSFAALKKADDLAQSLNAELVVVTIARPGAPGYVESEYHGGADTSTAEYAEGMLIKDIISKLADFKNELTLVVRCGNVVDEILKIAEEKHCDLIIIGNRGLSNIQKIFLGSVSSDVIEKTTLPVLVVKADK